MSEQEIVVQTKDSPPSCTITVSGEKVWFQGDFYHYVSGRFHRIRQGEIIVAKGDFLGLGRLKKRSNGRLVCFLALTGIFSLLSALSDKLGYLFFLNTEWLAVLLDVALICSLVGLAAYAFSKKSVVEISFLGKRICVDSVLLTEQDLSRLDRALKGCK